MAFHAAIGTGEFGRCEAVDFFQIVQAAGLPLRLLTLGFSLFLGRESFRNFPEAGP